LDSKPISYNEKLIPVSDGRCVIFMHVAFVCMCVLLYSSSVSISAYEIKGPLRECRLIRPGASRLACYCTQLVCVPDVIGVLWGGYD